MCFCFLSLLNLSTSCHWKRIINNRSDDLQQCKELEKTLNFLLLYMGCVIGIFETFKPVILLFTESLIISFACSVVCAVFLTSCDLISFPLIYTLWILRRRVYLTNVVEKYFSSSKVNKKHLVCTSRCIYNNNCTWLLRMIFA